MRIKRREEGKEEMGGYSFIYMFFGMCVRFISYIDNGFLCLFCFVFLVLCEGLVLDLYFGWD